MSDTVFNPVEAQQHIKGGRDQVSAMFDRPGSMGIGVGSIADYTLKLCSDLESAVEYIAGLEKAKTTITPYQFNRAADAFYELAEDGVYNDQGMRRLRLKAAFEAVGITTIPAPTDTEKEN